MSTLTIRIENELKSLASQKAKKLGIPLTLVIKTALRNFIENDRFVISEPQILSVDENTQEMIDKIADIV